MISELGAVGSKFRSIAGLLPGLALFLICMLSACTGVRPETAVPYREEGEAAMLSRVQTVAFPILLASADLCPFDQGNIWRRLGQTHLQQADSAQEFDQSHPTTEERIEVFETTLKEIEAKLVHGEALDPLAGRH